MTLLFITCKCGKRFSSYKGWRIHYTKIHKASKASKARKKKEGAEDSIAEDSIIECSGRR